MSFGAVLERLTKLENPYPGLRPFDSDESHLFFGRDQQVLDLLDRLARNRFVAVLGLSGSGKSSLVRAGLIPALRRGRILEPGLRWRTVVSRPSSAPFGNLAAALGCRLADLRTSSHGLIEHVRSRLDEHEATLVVVDQFEELFRYKDQSVALLSRDTSHATQASDAAAFIELLLAAARGPVPIYIVITMRTDYLGDCAEFPDFPEILNETQYLVPRLTREQRRQAIEGPLGGARISSALVERILNEAGDEPDQLPVLQHALMRTWSCWRRACGDIGRPIGTEDYESARGFAGALNQHADELLNSDAVRAEPEIAEIVFKRLTALSWANRERRDPAPLSELWALCGAVSHEQRMRVNAVIDVFRRGEASFLTPRDGVLIPDVYVDITHESLIRNWKILAERWVPDEERQAKTLIELVDRARGWQGGTRGVLPRLDLAAALEWDRRRNPSTTWAEHYTHDVGAIANVEALLSASREEFEKSERQKAEQQLADLRAQAERASARRTRKAAVVFLILALAAMAAAAAELRFWQLASRKARAAENALTQANKQVEQIRRQAETASAIRQAALSGDENAVNNLLAQLGDNAIQFVAQATDLHYRNPSKLEVYNFELYPEPNTLPTGTNAVAFVTYLADHPTFRDKLITAGPSSAFRASYVGWGCLNRIVALVEYKDPKKPPTVSKFNMCKSLGWER